MTSQPAAIAPAGDGDVSSCRQCGAKPLDDQLVCAACERDPSFLPEHRCTICGGFLAQVRRRLLPLPDLVHSWALVVGSFIVGLASVWAAAVLWIWCAVIVLGRRRNRLERCCLSCGRIPATATCGPQWMAASRFDAMEVAVGTTTVALLVALIVVPRQMAGIGAASDEPTRTASPGAAGGERGSTNVANDQQAPTTSNGRSASSGPRATGRKKEAPDTRSAKSLCGAPDATMAVPEPPSWAQHRCMTKDVAGIRWTSCLPRTTYAQELGAGCPGDELCCPPW